MRTINTYYYNQKQLHSFLDEEGVTDSPHLLVQVFAGHPDRGYLQILLDKLFEILPQATVIGSTTDGEIMDGHVSAAQTVISFTIFESTRLRAYGVSHEQDGYYSGYKLADKLVTSQTKLMIAFADGTCTNGDAFLSGIGEIDSALTVVGGMAGDNARFKQTYVFVGREIFECGAVAVVLDSDTLYIYNDYSFDWRKIGKSFTITKSDYNRVYTIDDKSAVELYVHYLGDQVGADLPAIGIEFPLIATRNGVEVARAVLAKHDDGSLTFAGNLKEGEQVNFGYGDPADILRHTEGMQHKLLAHPSESIFVYSCMARRHFMPEEISKEINPLQDIAPTSGFFTYGEFFTGQKRELLNQTMTIVSISESVDMPTNIYLSSSVDNIQVSTSVQALIHLANTTAQEAMQEEALRKEKATFEMLVEKSPDGILLIKDNKPIQCNQAMAEMFGCAQDERFLDDALPALLMQDNTQGVNFWHLYQGYIHDNYDDKNQRRYEWSFETNDGKNLWVDIVATRIFLDNENIDYLMFRNITVRKEMELELQHQKNRLFYQANHDLLTGLPNRSFFAKDTKQFIDDNNCEVSTMALLFFDLDRFKAINDSLGHNVGDAVLQVISKRLQDYLHHDGLIARLGGDEFVVVLKNIHKTMIVQVCQDILSEVSAPIEVENYTLYTSASIGISLCPDDSTNVMSLLKYADTAMYHSKQEGGNTFAFYSREMSKAAYEQVLMEKDLRQSLRNQDLEVYYQPQFDAQDGRVIGAEALIRWRHPELGLLTPGSFIDLAKKTGLILDLDMWVMQESIRVLGTWLREGLVLGRLALNMTMRQLEYPSLVVDIGEMLERYGVDSSMLELEVTEGDMMTKPDIVISALDKISKLGVHISIDDFGTGYSSLSHLKKLPIDKLKIDQSFIQDIPYDDDAVAIVKTVIDLARNLHLEVIAEGVENESQKTFLLEEGCRYVQGYHFSKPLNKLQMTELLQKNNGISISDV